MDKGQESTSQAGSTEAMDILSADIPDDTAATQSRNKEAMDIPSVELPEDTADADSSQESETCTASEGHLLAARHSEKKNTQDDQSGDETAAMALRKQNFQLEQDNEIFRKAMKQIKDKISKMDAQRDALRRLKDSVLNTEILETVEGLELVKAVERSIARLVKEVAKEMQKMDKGQESASQAGSTEAMDVLSAELPDSAATQSRNKEAMDILSMKLPDDIADADLSRESETCTASEGHLIAAQHSEKKHTQDDESVDETAAMAFLKLNIQSAQDIEMLRKRIKQIKDEISKVNAGRDALRKLKDSALNTERSETAEGLDLDKAVEGLDRLTHKRKK